MRIAWVQNNFATRGAICVGEFCDYARDIGISAKVYALGFDESFVGKQYVPIVTTATFDPVWWKLQQLDVAFFYRIDDFPTKSIAAAKAAGIRICIDCDTDGYLSPRQNILRSIFLRYDKGLTRLHQLKSLKALLNEWQSSATIERKIVANCELADVLRIESEFPAETLTDFFKSVKRADLAQKIEVIPFAVRSEFTKQPLNIKKMKLALAGGRLGAHQKNPALMAKIATCIGEFFPELQFELHIRGRSSVLERLNGRWNNVTLHHDTPLDEFRDRLLFAQFLVSSSVWESTPILGLEALCCGCSIIAPAWVPGYQSLVQNRANGKLYSSSSEIKGAIDGELIAWQTGKRSASEISEHWRSHCSMNVVLSRLLKVCN